MLKPANERLADFYFHDTQESESSEDEIPVHKPDPDSDTYKEEVYVIKELESASIRYIKKGGNYVSIQSGEHNQSCECFRCLFYTLRWSDLIERVAQYKITETSLLADDMLNAYANYKLNNFKEAVYQYEKIALKAWQTDRTISYFIATQNIKRLRNLVYFFLDSEEKEIVDKIDELNVEQVFNELHGIDEDQRELLKIVKDNKVLHSAEEAIDEVLDKTVKVRELYNSRGSYEGATLYNTVQIALERLFVFFTGNSFVFDEYSEFRRVCRKGVKALIANHSIHEDYGERLEKFNNLFFTISLHYLSPKDLKDITRKYGISKLPATSETAQTLVTKVDNLLSSGKATLELSSREEMNKILEIQFIRNWHFEHRFADIFKNGFFLLSAVDLEEEDVTKILKSAIHFLRVEKNTPGPRKVEHISIFMMSQGKFISYEQCVELLKIGVKKPQLFNSSNGLMQAVNHVINTHLSDHTIDDSLASSLLRLFKERLNPSLSVRFRNIIYLWSISSPVMENKIRLVVEQYLDKNFNVDDFCFALSFGVTSEGIFFARTLEFFSEQTGNGYSEIREGVPMRTQASLTLSNLIHGLYSRNLVIDEEVMKQADRLPDYVRFFLLPEKFDYSDFDPLWLLFYSPANDRLSVIYERLCKIEEVKGAVERSLKSNYNQGLAEVYTKYFL